MRMSSAAAIVSVAAISIASCVNVHVDPIYAKVDVNIKVDQELDSFFDTVQKQSSVAKPAHVARPAPNVPATVPVAPQPALPSTSATEPTAPSEDVKVVPPPPPATAPASAPAATLPADASPSK